MCKYCENLFTGNMSKNVLNSELAMNGVFIAGSDVYIDNNLDNKAYLKLTTTTKDSIILDAKIIKIKYCPFCGREF